MKYAFIEDNQKIYRNQSELIIKVAHSTMVFSKCMLTLQSKDIPSVNTWSDELKKSTTSKKEYDIKRRCHKIFKVISNSKHNKVFYPNLLWVKFNANRTNNAWVGNITYLWKTEGRLYLVAVKKYIMKSL